MTKIIIRNINDLKIFQAKLRSLKNILPELQKIAFEKSANDVLLHSIKTEMAANDVSQKIIEKTFISKITKTTNRLKLHVISNYVADNGFDVANAREEGTIHQNPIKSRNSGGALKIPVSGGGGDFIFRKSARPGGMPRLLVIERNIKKLQNSIKESYQENVAASVSSFLGGK